MSAENTQVENMQEDVVVEEVTEVESIQPEVEEKQFSNQITIFGTSNSYSWVGGDNGELHVSFCTFNTNIGEDTYRTNVGIKADGTPIAVISFNTEINVDVINFIVNHILMITTECATTNDEPFYNRTDDTMMAVENYNPIAPVLHIINVLHSWANIARFNSVAETQENQEG